MSKETFLYILNILIVDWNKAKTVEFERQKARSQASIASAPGLQTVPGEPESALAQSE